MSLNLFKQIKKQEHEHVKTGQPLGIQIIVNEHHLCSI